MLPKKVSILGQDWRIKVVPESQMEDSTCDGLCHHDKRLIEINETLSPDEQQQVLFHELMHAVMFTTAVGTLVSERNEEIIIRALEYSLWPILKQLLRS